MPLGRLTGTGTPQQRAALSAGANPAGGIVSGTIGQAQKAGLFDPLGSPVLKAKLRRRALRSAENRRRRGSVMAQLAGLDPYGQRQALVDTDREATGDVSDFLNQADEDMLMSGQDYARGLLGSQTDFERQRQLQRQAERAQRKAQGNALQQGIGSIVGRAAGSLIPGL